MRRRALFIQLLPASLAGLLLGKAPPSLAAPTSAKKFRARVGSGLSDADAQVIGNEIEFLLRNKKKVGASEILARARDPRSPLHKYFPWHEGEAADNWRNREVRRLVRSLCWG